MNLKQRFALLFTSFVAIILLTACATIYILYAGYRQEDFFNRIALEGNEVYEFYQESKKEDQLNSSILLKEVRDRSIFNEQLIIEDSTGKQVFSIEGNQPKQLSVSLKQNARKVKRYQYTDSSSIQHVIEFHVPTKTFIYVSGFDKIGFDKLKNLQIILAIVFLGGLLLTSILSFLFVKQAIKPIVQLSRQMQLTSIQNLSERINIKPAKDEINLIASNFNAMMDRLKAAFDSQKSFVHHASHELRTPLAVMLSQTEVALKNNTSIDDFKAVLVSLKEDQQHMIDLTNSLLLLSQYESFKFDSKWPLLRIDELLLDSISFSQRIYPDILIDFSFETIPDNEADLLIKCNDSLIKSIFTNLLKNGYQYSSDKKINISIKVIDKEILISFENTGQQLSEAESAHISLAFFRGENAKGKKGFGLGLSIIDRILAFHNGSIQYCASGNDQNRFTVILPIAGK